jgi:ABC-type transporter Mla subunit MlaD
VFEELKVEIQKLTVVTDKINTGILSTENQRNISDTLTNLKGTSEHFNVASQDMDKVVLDAKGAVDSAKQTLGTVNASAADVHSAIDDVKVTLAAAQELLAKARTGNGPIATLLNDPQLSQNLKAFVANLREHGVLFYKNKEPAGAPAVRRQ